jgi:hypothetical protein
MGDENLDPYESACASVAELIAVTIPTAPSAAMANIIKIAVFIKNIIIIL